MIAMVDGGAGLPGTWQESQAWGEFRAATGPRRDALRTEIARRHLPLLASVARAVQPRLTTHRIRVRELMSMGYAGLSDAIDAYDPARGATFATFATPRIRGAMLDELRDDDHVPRLVRIRQKKTYAAYKAAAERLRRRPTPDEIRRQLVAQFRLSAAEARRTLDDGLVRDVEPLGALFFDEDAGVPDRASPAPWEPAERREWWERVCQGLERTDRLIVLLYYREGMTMKETAAALGICESRVSQLHTAILAQLRARLTRPAA